MAVTAPAIAALVTYYTAGSSPGLSGGYVTVPALAINVTGLMMTLHAFGADGDEVFVNVPHQSTAGAGQPYWSWPAASGNSNA